MLHLTMIFWNWPVSAKHWITYKQRKTLRSKDRLVNQTLSSHTFPGTPALRKTERARVGSTCFTSSPSSSEHFSCKVRGGREGGERGERGMGRRGKRRIEGCREREEKEQEMEKERGVRKKSTY